MKALHCLGSVLAIFSFVSGVYAEESLPEVLTKVLESNEKVKAAERDLAAAGYRIKEVFGNAWYPNLQTTANYGRERQDNKPLDANTDMFPRELDIKLSQKLWDFGKSNADVRIMKLQYDQLEQALETARQTVLLDAITAYLNLKRVETALDYAKRSEANILKQTEIENTKVQAGQGYTTDVLQAKTQLAGAQARRIQAEGALAQVNNRVQAVFKREIQGVTLAEDLRIPTHLLPKDLDEAVAKAKEDNPQVKSLAFLAEVLADKQKALKAERFFPVINASVEQKFKDSVAAIEGYQREILAKVELTHQLNLGMTGKTALEAAERDEEAARLRLEDSLVQIREQVSNAWRNLETAKANAAMLRNQAELAERFLEVARQERQMGKRSLLDVLNGETALINSRSDAAAAEADISIAAYTLMKEVGHLTIKEMSESSSSAMHSASGSHKGSATASDVPKVEKVSKEEKGAKGDKEVTSEKSVKTGKSVKSDKAAKAKAVRSDPPFKEDILPKVETFPKAGDALKPMNATKVDVAPKAEVAPKV
ncbi:MAG: TolC family protein, partial [Magnetococcales bacterium]|nr:TolC family protein [Magnetococcales bacterium]